MFEQQKYELFHVVHMLIISKVEQLLHVKQGRLKGYLAFMLFLPLMAHAAKLPVSWIPPVTNDDGSTLTDLKFIRVEWGSCVGSAFGVLQASITVPGSVTQTSIYPTGLTKVCIRAFAINAAGAQSSSSNVASKVLSTLGKPQVLGQPITFP